MSDLISKNAVIKAIQEEIKQDRPDDFKIRNIQRFIEDIPVAYDVDKAIDDFAEKLCNECYEKSEKAVLDGNIMMDIVTLDCVNDLIMEISEQLKEGILSEQINK